MGIIKDSQSSQNIKFALSLQFLRKEVGDEGFLHADKHQSFLQVDFNTLGIKVSYKTILSLLLDMIRDSQYTKSKSFQYLYNISKKKL